MSALPFEPGLHLLHKPVGATSHALVREAMEALAAATVGAEGAGGKPPPVVHGGTLDPFAHGLLLLLVGPATRLFEALHAAPKTYEADVVWGAETDTGDLHGTVVSTGDASSLTPERLDAALRPFLGWQAQVPPATSAKKLGGEPAYRKAHRGEAVVLPPSRVYLHAAAWVAHALPHRSRLRLTCRGGFYVRALAQEVGRALGCGAHLAGLHRTAIGPWEDPGPEGPRPHVSGRGLLPWLPVRTVAGDEVNHLKHGRSVPAAPLLPPDWPLPEGYPAPEGLVRAFQKGRLVGLLAEDAGALRMTTPLWPGV